MKKLINKHKKRRARPLYRFSPLQICQTQFWTPQEPVSFEWIYLCTHKPDAVISYLQDRYPQSLQSLDRSKASPLYSKKKTELSFLEDRFIIDQDTYAPLFVAHLRLSQITSQSSHQSTNHPSPPQTSLLDPLSPRELDVLTALANGLSNREIAHFLVIAESTVKWHLKQIYGKLGACSRTQALALARTYQLIATLLLKAAQNWAKEKGATEMQLETWEFAEGPLPFYERLGYSTLRRHMVTSLL